MRFVRVFLHDNSLNPDVWQEPLSDAMRRITDRAQIAHQCLKETKADHIIYATKIYDGDNTVKEIHLYMEAMSEDTFQKRTKLWEERNHGIVYAAHKNHEPKNGKE